MVDLTAPETLLVEKGKKRVKYQDGGAQDGKC